MAEQKASEMRSKGVSAAGQDYPLQEPPIAQRDKGISIQPMAQGRPAGSSNDAVLPPALATSEDRLLALGRPYANPCVPTFPIPMVNFPIWDSATGVRPHIPTVSIDIKHLPESEAHALHECVTCDANSATRRCPKHKRLGNQGKSHNEVSHVTATCCNSGCRVALCG